MRIQSVLLLKTQFTRTAARQWIKAHGFVIVKPYVSPRYWHFPQRKPHPKGRVKFRFKHFPGGLKLLMRTL